MVTDNHYRWDFVGLSTDTKPTPATSNKVVDGSTFYCSDTSKLYVYCQDDWYERKPLGGGGGGGSYTAGTGIDITDDTISVDTDTIQEKLTAGTNITISDNVISASGGSVTPVQTTGDSTTDVMSQNATTSMVYDYAGATPLRPKIGNNTTVGGLSSMAIGDNSSATGNNATALGGSANTHSKNGAIALGYGSSCSNIGEMNIGTNNTSYGYNSSNYRLLTGVYDGQGLHDAATVAQGNTLSTSAPTTSTEGVLGQLWTDTTNMHTYQCTAIDTTDPQNPSYTWTQRW